MMAQVTAQLEAARSVAFVPDNVSIADREEQDEKDSSIWSDEDVEEQDELDEMEEDFTEDAELESSVDIKYIVILVSFKSVYIV